MNTIRWTFLVLLLTLAAIAVIDLQPDADKPEQTTALTTANETLQQTPTINYNTTQGYRQEIEITTKDFGSANRVLIKVTNRQGKFDSNGDGFHNKLNTTVLTPENPSTILTFYEENITIQTYAITTNNKVIKLKQRTFQEEDVTSYPF